MGTYELNDVVVQRFLDEWSECTSGPEIVDLIDAIKPQVPIPVPLGVGAVVLTDTPELHGQVVYIRWAHNNHTHSPWIAAGDNDQTYRTDEIGRIVRVLASGVETVDTDAELGSILIRLVYDPNGTPTRTALELAKKLQEQKRSQ